MDNREVAVVVDSVNKGFKLPHEQYSGVKQVFLNFYRRNKGYEIQHVLNDISFEIYKGEFFGIVGRNGSGKSTLLKLLAGIYTPNQGTIDVRGKLTPFIELGVGFNPELTGRENIYLNGALLGFSRKEMRAMYKDIVEFAELERFMDQKLKNYSSGMQVRLAFSIAIRAQSDILLIDEVLAVGDLPFQQKCFDTFKEIKRQGKTVIFVSHDLAAVESFCDRALLISNGKMLKVGPTRDVIREYSSLLADEESQKQKKKGGGVVHIGTGDVFITNASILDLKGKETKRLKEGQGFTVRIHYDAKKDIVNPVIGVGVMDKDNNSIIGPNTKETGFKTGVLKTGKGWVDTTINTNLLAPGVYSIRAAFFDETGVVPYDFAENLHHVKVTGPDRYGKIYTEPTWSIGKHNNA